MGVAPREILWQLVGRMSFPFRLGATSYIIPADIIPNVRYLAGKVRDVELVLFDLPDGPSNLPTPAQVTELRAIALDNDLTFSVHLPLDLRMDSTGGPNHPSLEKARRVIDCTRDLQPFAYIAHLDGRELNPSGLQRWQADAIRALRLVGDWLGDLSLLALENLEGFPLDLHTPILDAVPVSRTVDIGHLWLDLHDPIPYLRTALPRTSVIHLHGVSTSDHVSLAHLPAAKLSAVIHELLAYNYTGVVTLEMFSERDFLSSLVVLEQVSGHSVDVAL